MQADVEAQPYAFTTKSSFVGHINYQYLSISSPVILYTFVHFR